MSASGGKVRNWKDELQNSPTGSLEENNCASLSIRGCDISKVSTTDGLTPSVV